MITDYLFLGPNREVLCNLDEIRQYVDERYDDWYPCTRCGCYLIPTKQRQRFVFRIYRCANSICSASFRSMRVWPQWPRRVA